MSYLISRRSILFLIVALWFGTIAAQAQTTEFTYQGKLTDNNMSPTASYDFQFSLFSVDTNGTAIGSLQRLGVPVSNGTFTVKLDFGNQFTGATRYLEIAVRPAGNTGGFQQLLPRQPITAAPYSVRSLNSTTADAATTATTANNSLQLGGVAANQFVQTTDSRLTDSRNPLAGSTNYIQNRTTQQTSTNFNITGTGTANVFDAATGFNIAGNRAFSISGQYNANTFVGIGAGAVTSSGSYYGNAFFGTSTGDSNTTGDGNSFFGAYVGGSNTTGDGNTFVGNFAGRANTTGSYNTSVGDSAGETNATGSHNTIIGIGSDVGSANLNYATAIGAFAIVSTSNTIALGRSDGSDTVDVPGKLQIDTLGTVGSTNLCLNASNRVATCSSSLRYKTNVETFFGGLDIVKRLRPITFNWIDGGKEDVGFAAEEVNQIEPLLSFYNKAGQIEGVKYGQITTVLVNAVKEQQTEIERLQEQIKLQNQQFEILKKLVCTQNAQAEICKEEQK